MTAEGEGARGGGRSRLVVVSSSLAAVRKMAPVSTRRSKSGLLALVKCLQCQIHIYLYNIYMYIVCCSVLQCVAVRWSVLECVHVSSVKLYIYSVLQCVEVCCSALRCVAKCSCF